LPSLDLVLSSGFLAFARHAGFLAAVEEVGLPVEGVCGTSSGALAGALWAAGMPAREILQELCGKTPLDWARWHPAPWRGLWSLDQVVAELEQRLPATFEALPRPLGVGVATHDRAHLLLTSGPLPLAVAASCAVPWLFLPVKIADRWLHDGGAVDRTALAAWRAHRPEAQPVVHLVERTAGARQEPVLDGLTVVRSPPSGARLWSLGDVQAAFELTRQRALQALADPKRQTQVQSKM
jgi:predicted acylesterase/phospholipase RssA